MSTASPEANGPSIRERAVDSTLRIESQAFYLAAMLGAVGAVVGFVITQLNGHLRLAGPDSFGLAAACCALAVAALVGATGYWRSSNRPGQEWRKEVPQRTVAINTVSVVVVHAALAFLATYATFLVLSQALIGLRVNTLFGMVMMAAAFGLTTYVVFPSVAHMTTQRMATLLLAFMVVGALTSAVTTEHPLWWKEHFSQLGSYNDLSSWIFNATLIGGGLLVTTFAVYISNDMKALVNAGALADHASPHWVARMFVIMGVMLACVGLAPVDDRFWIHTIAASGMAVVFLILLIRGKRLLAGMPAAYFHASWAFIVALLAGLVLWLVKAVGLTAFEIIAFGLIFAWILVFIRFLGLAGEES